MEKRLHAYPSIEVDYQDVFGGPPRFAALMSAAPHSGMSQSATFEKMTTQASSFRTSSLPVFDLPVFGNDASTRSRFCCPRANSDVHDDMFDKERPPLPEGFSASNLYCAAKSQSSSLSSSWRMSPVHPVFVSAGQSEGDERLVAKTRPPVGRFSKRGSLSSTSSFDESGGKLSDALLFGTTKNSFSSSLPSSPPQSDSFGCMKSSGRASDGIGVGAPQANSEADGTFEYDPQRCVTQQFLVVPHDSISTTHMSESHSSRMLESEKPGPKIFSASDALQMSATIQVALPRSSSIKHAREQRDEVVWMTRRANSSVSERSELAAERTSVSAYAASFLCQASSEHLQPPPAPVTPLKYKSWKDLLSDGHSACNSSSSKLVFYSIADLKTQSSEMPIDNDAAYAVLQKQMDVQTRPETGQLYHISAASQRGEAFPAVSMTDMEERELQALLTNAWKVNKEIEWEKYHEKFPIKAAKHSTRNTNSSNTQRHKHLDEKDSDLNWKEWRKFDPGETRKVSSNDSAIDSPPIAILTQADKDGTTFRDRAEIIRGAPEGHVFPDGLNGLDSKKILRTGMIGTQKGGDLLVKRKVHRSSEDLNADGCLPDLTNRLSQLLSLQKFSETSDGKIKKWAAGKEENLRALLSNLQHVLWLECGWQPIPLSDLIEVPDVKKAYRKATLVVHPDKLQQKGASIEQKYIAERVFGILQEAWKTFSLQESL